MAKSIQKTDYQKRIQSASWILLLIAILTLVNVFVLCFEGDQYVISGSSIAIALLYLGKIYCGQMDDNFYVDKWANLQYKTEDFYLYMVLIAVAIACVFLLLGLLAKKYKAFIFIGSIFVIADTIFLFATYDFGVMVLFDYGIHILMVIMNVLAMHAAIKLKQIKKFEENFIATVKHTHRDSFYK